MRLVCLVEHATLVASCFSPAAGVAGLNVTSVAPTAFAGMATIASADPVPVPLARVHALRDRQAFLRLEGQLVRTGRSL